jgi:hypothetical protein
MAQNMPDLAPTNEMNEPLTSSPSFEVIIHKTEDVINTAVEGDSAVFDITSPSGIGGATVRLSGRTWPEHLILYLHLQGLEQFRLGYGEVVVTTAVSSQDGSTYQSITTPNVTEQPIEPGSPYWLKTNVVTADGSSGTTPLENGYFVLELPADFRQSGAVEFSLEWVDFFR